MYPDRITAEKILAEAEKCNPGPWGNHSRTAAHCAEKIAESAGLDKEKAYRQQIQNGLDLFAKHFESLWD